MKIRPFARDLVQRFQRAEEQKARVTTYLNLAMDYAAQTVRDAGCVLGYPCRITANSTQSDIHDIGHKVPPDQYSIDMSNHVLRHTCETVYIRG
jgi:hypothetical protein